MKTIDLATVAQPVEELLDLAENDEVLIRLPDGKKYLLTSVTEEESDDDEFANEVAQTRRSAAIMELIKERMQDTTRISAQEAKKRLGLD